MIGSKVLFWDFDETLGYREGKWTQTVLDILAKKKINRLAYNDISPRLKEIYPWGRADESHNAYMKNKTWWHYMEDEIARILSELGLNKKTATETASDVREEYLRPERWHLYDDTIPVLERTRKKGWRNIILSNHVPDLPLVLHHLGLDPLLDGIITSGAVGYEKPNKKIFLYAITAAGFPRHAVMVGDNITADIQGATVVGMNAILVRKPNTFSWPHYARELTNVMDALAALTG